jgi:hypothetical protein
VRRSNTTLDRRRCIGTSGVGRLIPKSARARHRPHVERDPLDSQVANVRRKLCGVGGLARQPFSTSVLPASRLPKRCMAMLSDVDLIGPFSFAGDGRR